MDQVQRQLLLGLFKQLQVLLRKRYGGKVRQNEIGGVARGEDSRKGRFKKAKTL
ncbi:MAG: hypothetical protein ACOC90_08375 [Bacteroidota bacterium]